MLFYRKLTIGQFSRHVFATEEKHAFHISTNLQNRLQKQKRDLFAIASTHIGTVSGALENCLQNLLTLTVHDVLIVICVKISLGVYR